MASNYTVEVLQGESEYGDIFWRLVITHHGKVIREERDGGEPEDQLLVRDWKWVADALREAYALGVADGKS